MSQYIIVHAKPGTRLTRPGTGVEFIGFKRVKPGEPCDFQVRGGFGYVLKPEGERVRNTRRIRMAIREGALSEHVEKATVSAPSADEKETSKALKSAKKGAK